MTFQEKLDLNSMPVPESGCVIWLRCLNGNGYGALTYNGIFWLAHRASWALTRGTIPRGLYVLHKCDVRCCINPEHLYLGSAFDNARDCQVQSGRAKNIKRPGY